jgi:hypothetical protein
LSRKNTGIWPESKIFSGKHGTSAAGTPIEEENERGKSAGGNLRRKHGSALKTLAGINEPRPSGKIEPKNQSRWCTAERRSVSFGVLHRHTLWGAGKCRWRGDWPRPGTASHCKEGRAEERTRKIKSLARATMEIESMDRRKQAHMQTGINQQRRVTHIWGNQRRGKRTVQQRYVKIDFFIENNKVHIKHKLIVLPLSFNYWNKNLVYDSHSLSILGNKK